MYLLLFFRHQPDREGGKENDSILLILSFANVLCGGQKAALLVIRSLPIKTILIIHVKKKDFEENMKWWLEFYV